MDDRISLNLLRQFIVVAEELHFGRAAERLGIAQPPLSQRVRRLEELVGFPLFERTSRSVRLTDAGRVLYESASRTMTDLAHGVEDARIIGEGYAGTLSIGYVMAAMMTFLPRIVSAFRSARRGVVMRLHEQSTAPQLAALRGLRLDVAIVTEPPADSLLKTWVTWREPFVAAVPASHRFARARRVSPARLASEDFLLFPRAQTPELHDRIVAMCRKEGFTPRVTQEAQSWAVIASLVGAGVGVAIVPESTKRFRTPNVRYLALPQRLDGITTALCTRAEEPAPAVRAFIETARRLAP
jgi:DNA-binding transcriptional LysR family regulator